MRNLNTISNTLLGTVLLGVTLMLVVLSVTSIKYTNRMVSQYSSLVATSIDIKLKVATAHLWFEEIMSGDRNESMDTIWHHLEDSDRAIDTMLNGEIRSDIFIDPVDDPQIRQDISDVKGRLALFSDITRERFASKQYAGVGSPIDQKYDAVFTGLLGQMDKVINELTVLSKDDLEQFNLFQKLIIILILISGTLVGYLLYLYQQRLLLLLTNQLEINQALSETKTRFQDIAFCGGDWIWEVDLSGRYTYVSEKVIDIIGYSPDEMIGHSFFDLMPPDESERLSRIFSSIVNKRENIIDLDSLNIHKNGKAVCLRSNGVPVFDSSGQLTGYRGVDKDVTEQKAMNDELIRSQKMSALEKFATGIANDFNNLLGVIIGYTELMQDKTTAGDQLEKNTRQILNAGNRAKMLTAKLLSFTREAGFSVVETDINQVLRDKQHEMEVLLSEHVELHYELEVDIWRTCVDISALEEAIMNITLNAKQAIQDTGSLTITTRNINLGGEEVRSLNVRPGDYVTITFTDTGCGMDAATQLNIFDPFYTTKAGSTGLGLSQVYGFTRHSGGAVHVSSQPGRGTQMTMYLPRYSKAEMDEDSQQTVYSSWSLSGDETILVVDAEEALRNLVNDVLGSHGYTVLTAENGEMALQILETETVDLLISDVAMQDMDGYELAHRAKKVHPELSIQIVSAHGAMRHSSKFDETLHQQRLQKPYSTSALLRRVREILDRK